MLYILAFLFPPLAVLICGKPGQALINLVLSLCLWLPGTIHAILVINKKYADDRAKMIANSINKN